MRVGRKLLHPALAPATAPPPEVSVAFACMANNITRGFADKLISPEPVRVTFAWETRGKPGIFMPDSKCWRCNLCNPVPRIGGARGWLASSVMEAYFCCSTIAKTGPAINGSPQDVRRMP